jgi:hypothetical protein
VGSEMCIRDRLYTITQNNRRLMIILNIGSQNYLMAKLNLDFLNLNALS